MSTDSSSLPLLIPNDDRDSSSGSLRLRPIRTAFEVHVAKEDFKFHAAHFVAYDGFRERLHGHNYKVGVRLLGCRKIASDGYVVDFGTIKTVTRKICKQLNEHFLCPMLSDAIKIDISSSTKESVTLTCQDGATFVFPKDDCALLPIVHSTTEELAVYLWTRIVDGLNANYLQDRGVHTMEIVVSEATGQEASFRLEIPNPKDNYNQDDETTSTTLDVRSFILQGKVTPMPCPSVPATYKVTNQKCEQQDCCQSCRRAFSSQLQKLALALQTNNVSLAELTGKDLQNLLENVKENEKEKDTT